MNDEYSLFISNVSLEDADSYKCQVDECAFQIESKTAYLTVYGKTSNVQLKSSDLIPSFCTIVLPSDLTVANEFNGVVEVLESEESEWLICSSNGSVPKVTVRWYQESGEGMNCRHGLCLLHFLGRYDAT